jgi:sensor domain CHASE-containing protein
MGEPEEASTQYPKPQAPEQQPEEKEEEAYDDSHLDTRGDHEFQGYNMLKDRQLCHTRIFDPNLLQKKRYGY